MNESLKWIKRKISKVACMTMIMTLFTVYGNVLADEGSDLNEQKTKIRERIKEVTEDFMKSLNDESSASNMCNDNIRASIYRDETENGIMEIKVYLENAKDEGKSLQIWATKGGKHLLLKDYGVTMGVLGEEWEKKRMFKWQISGDFQSVAKENVYRRNEEDVLRNYLENRADIGVYLKLKDGNKIKTYYKKLSGNPVEQYDAYLITSYDTNYIKENKSMTMEDAKGCFDINAFENLNVGYMTQFPAVAVKGKNFGLGMIKEFSPCQNNNEFWYSITIKGDNQYEREVVKQSNRFNGIPHFWIPDEDGIFNIIVKNLTSNEIISVRKVFVRKNEETNYLDLENFEVFKGDSDGKIHIRAEVDNFKENNQIMFRVGETFSKNVKTLKNYGQGNNDMELLNDNKVNWSNSAENGTLLGDGMYFVDALVKQNHSIEYEDIIRKYYSKNDMLDYFELTKGDIPQGEGFEFGIVNGKIKYRNDSKDYNPRDYIANKLYKNPNDPNSGREEVAKRFTIEKVTNDEIGDVEYKFLIWDARGKRVIRDYSDKNYLDYYFRDPGKYKIYGRIRRKAELQPGYMENSYFQEVYMDIEVKMPGEREVKINKVEISSYNATKNNNTLFRWYENKPKDVLKAHTKNLIKIDAEYQDGEDGRLMYKVYAIHDGYWELVTPYTASAVIPFYPRSTGDYKILVLVKDSISGSDEAKMYIEAWAED